MLENIGITGDFLDCLKALYKNDSISCEVNGLNTRPIFLKRGLRQGCALSPMLFALYITCVGNKINESKEGFKIGIYTISGLLFAGYMTFS